MPDIDKELKQLEEKGFSLDEINKSELTIAFLSLRSALQAWFSTSQFYTEDTEKLEPGNYEPQYFELYSETIIHFHHFFELIMKDILRKEHPLLVEDASKNHVLLYKLLKNKEIASDEKEKPKSIEFSTTLDRIIALLKGSFLDKGKYDFILSNESILKKTNYLRNRLVHRGTFVLPYTSLDELTGKYLLPLVDKFINLPECKNQERLWKYVGLSCNLDPLSQLSEAFKDDHLDFGKTALIKELGRAAYQTSTRKKKGIQGMGLQYRAEVIAKKYKDEERMDVYDVLNCPVCGGHSLVRFYEIRDEYPDFSGRSWLETISVQCYCCTLELTKELKNASEYNIDIDDYWLTKE